MWQTMYYIIGSVCTVALTWYGISSLSHEKVRKDRVQCERCKFCEEVYSDNRTRCDEYGIFSYKYRPRYCRHFLPKDKKVESNCKLVESSAKSEAQHDTRV